MSFRSTFAALLLAGALYAADPAVEKANKLIADKKFDDAITTLDAADKAKPKNADIQKALANAYLGKADSLMYNAALPPRQKYPDALRNYRKVLLYDKTNKKATEGVNTIEGIYKQMGRPIPQ